ncbi:PaaX family transcriptional regulator C-terminal domain-containing protein [Jannaschia aquimarina]|uniref:PaaX protein n=1 Tax=Jannaschia aquimarina TaxID=935700 RepID=A0A0D1EIQ7_9RHOB|nr:PaaX family transcriptional regulator C-terminal domain-containing protein [Jannaschia aquimarina]KIT16781.1 Transcriptional repressor PaaX [Jannaschia aquimarina]SNS52512.1 transcriptional regulator, PaaX family [Jannaschia aquimarina]
MSGRALSEAAFDRLLAPWFEAGPPRVWSLLVTLFGDLAQHDGARIEGAVLRAVLGRVGIRPEAVRVALHRLRADGWIESHRVGRNSSHQLTALGRSASAEASPRIYATAPDAQRAWLLIGDASDSVRIDGAMRVGPNLSVAPSDPGRADLLVLPLDDAVPGWLSDRLCPPDLIAAAARLERLLRMTAEGLPADATLTPLQVAALRMLIVHEWRRIALKAPHLPDHVLPDDWRGPECRRRVSGLLARLDPPAPEKLAEAA